MACAICALLPLSAIAEPKAGAYLAARQAAFANDFKAGARYFTQTLIGDPTNPYLLENALVSYVALGDFERAKPIATIMTQSGIKSQMAHIVLSVDAAAQDNWDHVFSQLESGLEIGPLVDGLTQSWGYVGKGQMSAALESFDALTETAGLAAYSLYNKALALSYVGDFESADAIFAGSPANGMRYNRRSAIVHAQIMSQLGRNADALALIDGVFGPQTDPTLAKMRAVLVTDAVLPFTFVHNARDGLSEVYLIVAQALLRDGNDDYTLRYARAAVALNAANTDAVLLTANLLENLGQYDLATATYSTVVPSDPAHQSAELGRSEALRKAGRTGAAIEALQALARAYPDMPRVHATAGDAYRESSDFKAAKTSYTKALALYDDADPLRWFIHYTRGITYHTLNDWPAAEADFRAALVLRPDQPQVLNYLGYSMVERGINMEEALGMIESAVAAEPQNGAIVDSLGWVLFQRGEFDTAVGHLENAAALMPIDPIINDHLGDAYWAVGRLIEAEFQWNRALSFDPLETDATRIRRKLEIGLDAVLVEEGTAPLEVASGDN
ncbi:MAG: tetratricopeptide repeat protein [Yoonia sp.]|nr:tetratricopeptide repeat protein [Yoonia sp.]